MKKTASWLSNSITPSAALYEFEETILPQIMNTKHLFEKRKIEDVKLTQDIEKFYANLNRAAQALIHQWEQKLQLQHTSV